MSAGVAHVHTDEGVRVAIQAAPAADAGELDLATRRRAEILCGSIRVVARDGVVAAKLKDIARESGVSLGLIQHYFDTRENLIDATFGAMMQVVSRATAQKADTVTDPLQLVYEVIRLHVFGTVAFPERWGFWSELWAGSGRSDHLRGVATKIYELWARPIEAALRRLEDQGRLPAGADPARLTTGMLAIMDGLAIRTLAEPELFDQEFMLQVLDDWATAQLGVDPTEAARIRRRLADQPRRPGPAMLTPELVAAALLDPQVETGY